MPTEILTVESNGTLIVTRSISAVTVSESGSIYTITVTPSSRGPIDVQFAAGSGVAFLDPPYTSSDPVPPWALFELDGLPNSFTIAVSPSGQKEPQTWEFLIQATATEEDASGKAIAQSFTVDPILVCDPIS
ncbi:MAG: hypothetical protein AAGN46_12570 [Acidobacteriota bacterium]